MRRMAVSIDDMNVGIQRRACWNEESKVFMGKVMEVSGLGPSTFLPDGAPSCCRVYLGFSGHTREVIRWQGGRGLRPGPRHRPARHRALSSGWQATCSVFSRKGSCFCRDLVWMWGALVTLNE